MPGLFPVFLLFFLLLQLLPKHFEGKIHRWDGLGRAVLADILQLSDRLLCRHGAHAPFPCILLLLYHGVRAGRKWPAVPARSFSAPAPAPEDQEDTPGRYSPGRRTVRLDAPGKTKEGQRQPQRLSAPQGRPLPVHLRTPSWRRSCRRSSRTGASPPGAPVAPGQRPPGQQARAADPARTGLSHRRGPAWRPPAAPR